MWESRAHFSFSVFLNMLNSGNNVKDYVFEDVACFIFKIPYSKNKWVLEVNWPRIINSYSNSEWF